MPEQTTSTEIAVIVQALPPLDVDDVPDSELAPIVGNRESSGALEIFLVSTQDQTLANVRVSLREDSKWAICAQPGIGDVFFATLELVANRSVKFVVADVGRPTAMVISAGFIAGLSAIAKRLEN